MTEIFAGTGNEANHRDYSGETCLVVQVIIVDEAHRLKSTTAATREAIRQCNRDFLLLLTGRFGRMSHVKWTALSLHLTV